MRADVRVPIDCGDEEPCGSTGASSDGTTNGDVPRKSHSPSVRTAKHVNGIYTVTRDSHYNHASHRPKKAHNGKQKRTGTTRNAARAHEEPIVYEKPQLQEEIDVDSGDDTPGPSSSFEPLFGYGDAEVVPWATKGYYPLSMQGLHDEILDAYEWLRPSRLETEIRYKVYEKVREQILRYWSPLKVNVSVFGSLRTRLYLPSSDIDILVECPDWDSEEAIQAVMERTARALDHTAQQIVFYAGAFVPIIKFIDRDTKLNIDVSFNTVQGVKAALYMEKVKSEFPVVMPLLLLLKQLVYQYKLHEAYNGGLSSYGLMLMVVNFLQIHHSDHRHLPIEDPKVNLGYLLLRFLEVYGNELNYSRVAIDLSECQYEDRSQQPAECPVTDVTSWMEGGRRDTPVILSVHDPLHEGNEVCRSSYNIFAVRNLFQSALFQLRVVFIGDRPDSLTWRRHVYKGSILGRLFRFTADQVHMRNRLKGFVLYNSQYNYMAVSKTILVSSILSDPIDVACLWSIPKTGTKVLEIKRPEEEANSTGKKKDEEGGKKMENGRGEEGEEKREARDDSIETAKERKPSSASIASSSTATSSTSYSTRTTHVDPAHPKGSVSSLGGGGPALRRNGERSSQRGAVYQPPALRKKNEAAAAKKATSALKQEEGGPSTVTPSAPVVTSSTDSADDVKPKTSPADEDTVDPKVTVDDERIPTS